MRITGRPETAGAFAVVVKVFDNEASADNPMPDKVKATDSKSFCPAVAEPGTGTYTLKLSLPPSGIVKAGLSIEGAGVHEFAEFGVSTETLRSSPDALAIVTVYVTTEPGIPDLASVS
jgi:hypothetical protein